MIEPLTLVLLLLLGVWAAVDGVSVGQFMVSRPLVAGVLAGAILGDPWIGVLVGGVLELLNISLLPVGGVRLPEPGPAAVGAVVAAALWGGAGGIATGIALGIALSFLGGWSVTLLRGLNVRVTAGAIDAVWDCRELSRRHLACVGLDAGRGALVTGLGLGAALVIPPDWTAFWPLALEETLALPVLAGMMALGALNGGPRERRRTPRWLLPAAGLALGGMLGWWLG